MRGRRCIRCERRLLAEEQGALCSPCYFEEICGPATAPAPAARAPAPVPPARPPFLKAP